MPASNMFQMNDVSISAQAVDDFLVADSASSWVNQHKSEVQTTLETITQAERDKLAGIEASSTGNLTAAEVKSLYESNANTNAFTDPDESKLDGVESGATADQTAAEVKTLYESNSDTNAYTDAEKTKLTAIEASATADQTAVEIKTAYESNADTNAYSDADKSKLGGVEPSAQVNPSASSIKVSYESNADTNAFTNADESKLDGIEASATADLTAGEVKTLYESNANTNVFTDGEQSKLTAIEASATADQTAAEIKTAYESNVNTNAYIDSEKTKLAGVEASATADLTAGEVKTLYESNADTNVFTDGFSSKLNAIESGATTDQTDVEIKTAYENNANTNAYTDSEKTKLGGIEASAQVNPTDAQIKVAYENNANTNAFTDAEQSKLSGIEASATADQTAAEIKTAYESNANTNAFTDADESKLDGVEAGATTDQTAAEIKTAYESNTNTNAFTDADESKLDGVESGAQVNLPLELGINNQTDDYILVPGDARGYVRVDDTVNTFVVIPESSNSIPVGTEIELRQVGSGTVAVINVIESSVNLPEISGVAKNALKEKGSTAKLVKVAGEVWDLQGDVESTVAIPAGPTITSSSISPSAEVASAYSVTLTATGGTGDLMWCVLPPPGLSLNAETGVISGLPSEEGTFDLEVIVEDSFIIPQIDTKSIQIPVGPAIPLRITTDAILPDVIEGSAFSVTLAAVEGQLPLNWSASTNMPSWLSLNASSGELTGTPSTLDIGVDTFEVTVADASSTPETDSKDFTVEVKKESDLTFLAEWTSSLTADFALGATGTTAVIGNPTISGGYLVMTGGSGQRVDYNAGGGNADSVNEGAFRFIFKPAFNGIGSGRRIFFDLVGPGASGQTDGFNRINLFQSGGNYLLILGNKNTVGTAGRIILNFGTLNVVAGTEYEFEVDWKTNSPGEQHLFINGNRQGVVRNAVVPRDSNLTALQIGNTISLENRNDFSLRKFQVFNKMQHTTNYCPQF